MFILVGTLTLVQGTTLPAMARRLGLLRPGEPREMQVDAAPLDVSDAVLLQVRIPDGSRLHGVYLAELRLPAGATVNLIVRAGHGFTPQPSTRLQEQDQLLVVTTMSVRTAAERRGWRRRLRTVGCRAEVRGMVRGTKPRQDEGLVSASVPPAVANDAGDEP